MRLHSLSGSLLAALAVLAACKEEPSKPQVSFPEPVAAKPEQTAPAPAPSGPTGSIDGMVFFKGTPPTMAKLNKGTDPVCSKFPGYDEQVLVKDGKLQNVFVRITEKPAVDVKVPSAPVVVDQIECMFRPRVQGAVEGQLLQVRNSDGTLHNVHAFSGTKSIYNQAQPPHAAPLDKQFPPGTSIMKIKCDIHTWMTAYIHVVPHPFFAVSDDKGQFKISGLPPGDYTLEAWHERYGTKTIPVTVKANEAAQAEFTYTPEDG